MGCCIGSPQPTQAVQSHGAHATSQNLRGQEVNEAVELVKSQFLLDDSLSNIVNLHISCENLPNMDRMSKTDPFAIVYLMDKNVNEWKEKGRTEVIYDNLCPSFVKAISIKFMFEERQPMKLEIYDVDNPDTLSDLSKQEFVGSVELQVHEICRAPKQTLQLSLKNPKIPKNGIVRIYGDQIQERGSSNVLKMCIEGRAFSGHRSIFYVLSRTREVDGTEFLPVYKSELAKLSSTYGYHWRALRIGAAVLIKDDPSRRIQIELFEYKSNGDHKPIESQTYSFQELLKEGVKWQLKSGGSIEFKNVDIELRSSFLDYIFGGCQISLITAIDYTMSNQDPRDPNSLHFFDMTNNQYIRAIQAVGSILECYDSDKMIPVLGFGAKLPPYPDALHCFSLNGNIFNPEVPGTQGVLSLYQNSLPKLKLSGPTNFSEIINYAAGMAEAYYSKGYVNSHNYFILMILTDGAIMDFKETTEQIVRASNLPLSIIIVGVGDEDFIEMDKLDADETPLYSARTQKYMSRDIVQFVPYNKFKDDPESLARETLAEIPKQLVDFMSQNKVEPLGGQAHINFNFFEEEKEKMRNYLLSNNMNPQQVENALLTGVPSMHPKAALGFACGQYRNPLLPFQNIQPGPPMPPAYPQPGAY